MSLFDQHTPSNERTRKLRKNRIGRRAFAKSVGLGALALPYVASLRSRTRAQEGEIPKRLLVFFSPNGSVRENWRPSGGERDFALSTILQDLEPFKDRLTIIDGLDMRSTRFGPGDGHQMGMGHMLTATDLLPGDTMGGCDSCAPVSWAGGISIDQKIANHIGTTTPFRSVELAARPGGSNVWTRMAYAGPGEPIPPEDDPYRAFERLFADLEVDPGGAARRQLLQGSVLDAVQADFSSLQRRLGREDRERLQIHLDVISDLETRLASAGTIGAACEAPMLGDRIDPTRDENFPMTVDLQMDIITAAFACDLTRVGSLQWNRSVGNVAFPWIGVPDRHHDLSHEGDGNADAMNKITEINRWYAGKLAELCARLDAIPEPGGTLLDNTLIIWVNELGRGNSHTRNDLPIVMAGSAGGAFDTGRYLQMDRSHADWLRTLAIGFGLPDEPFGRPDVNEGALTTLLAS